LGTVSSSVSAAAMAASAHLRVGRGCPALSVLRENARIFLKSAGHGRPQLTKTYDSFAAVKGINVEIRAGEVFGLLGKNGAGKTAMPS
jgi:ABC-type polysaccharide/polyol phosphate transport system ATPase subunit